MGHYAKVYGNEKILTFKNCKMDLAKHFSKRFLRFYFKTDKFVVFYVKVEIYIKCYAF